MKRYHTAFRHFPQPALLLALDNRVLDANLAAVEAYGARPGGAPDFGQLKTDMVDWLATEIARFRESGGHMELIEKRHPRLFGERFFRIRMSKTGAAPDDDVILIFTEITERRKYVQELVFLATMVESSTDAIIGLSASGEVVSWNRAAEDIYGYAGAEMLGRSITVTVPRGRLREHEDVMARVVAGERFQGLETVRLRRDGKGIRVSLTVSPILGETGDIMGVSVIARDITARKRAERELRRARIAAEAASRAKTQFLANISHELRTPLNGIIGMIRLVLESPLLPDQEELLGLALRSSGDLMTIVNDLLELSAVETGKATLRLEPFDPRAVLDVVVKAFAVQARIKGLDFAVRPGPELPGRLLGDPGRIKQILVNLLGNAMKFTERGGVTISLAQEPSPDRPGARRLTARVSDSGPGIDPALHQAIFDSFTVAEDFLTKKLAGAGLGLSISRQLAKAMGGALTVRSEPGRGSEFVFRADFDLAGEKDVKADEPGRLEPDLSGLRILVVEDEPINRIVAARALEKLGHVAECAINGQEALERLVRERFDAVLLDIQMPVLSGLQATTTIRSGGLPGLDPDIPIIALTAHAMEQDRRDCLAAGVDVYLAKPFEPQDLRSALARALGRRASGRVAGQGSEP